MKNRTDLQAFLEELLGSKEVYFQPPMSLKMKYPCFRYSLENIPAAYANDNPYKTNERYLVMYITKNPDPALLTSITETKGFAFERYYAAENLHHYVYTYTFY